MILLSFSLPLLLVQTVIAASSNSNSNLLQRHRRGLAQEKFLSYEPVTTVTSDAAIDLDQKLMEKLLAVETKQAKYQAMQVYMLGGFSKNLAEIHLIQQLNVNIPQNTEVFGTTKAGKQVSGTVQKEAKSGDNSLTIEYHAGPNQASYVNCQVGGNPYPNTEGCFAASGVVEIGDLGNFQYTYNVTSENFNGRTLQLMSTEAKSKMYECQEGCPHSTFVKFYNYYGQFDYANQLVMAAFNNALASFSLGAVNFASYEFNDTSRAVSMGTAYLSVWMHAISEMEKAVGLCEKNCTPADNCNEERVHAWDKAVAFYTGSIPKRTGEGGYFTYSLAQELSLKYGTYIQEGTGSGMARSNADIYRFFSMGLQNLQIGECQVVNSYAQMITNLMSLPLVQSTLQLAYAMDKQNNNQKVTQAQGAMMAASVLPLVHACNATDASIIYENMKAGKDLPPNFDAVKAAFENNYECMGITCQGIGGLVNTGDGVSYLTGFAPCGTANIDTSTSTGSNKKPRSANRGPNVRLAVGLTLGIVGALIILALLISRKRNDIEYMGSADPEYA